MLAPLLFLDFTTASLDGRIAFTRSTSASNPASFVNSSGLIELASDNQPRFSYNPITLACRGILIESSRANLITYSSSFNDASWLKATCNTTGTPPYIDVAISPDGTQNADKFIPNSGQVAASFTKSVSVTSGAAYTYSFFAKASEQSKISMVSNIITSFRTSVFNLQTGTVQSTGTGWLSTIENFGNGWYRCASSFTADSTTSRQFQISNNGSGWTGNGSDGVFIWGAQLEVSAFPTSYIPTSASSLTRNADIATMTGTNFSDWWQAGIGGVTVIARPGTVSGITPWLQFDDNTADNLIALRGNTTNPELYIKATTDQAQIDAGTIAANTNYNLTGWWQTNNCKARLDSGAAAVDTSATIPTVTQARLGSDGTNYLNGHLASIAYYDVFSSRIYTRRKNKVVSSLL